MVFSIRALSSYQKSTKIVQSTLAWIGIGTFYDIRLSAFLIVCFLQKWTKKTQFFHVLFFIYAKKFLLVSTVFLRIVLFFAFWFFCKAMYAESSRIFMEIQL